MIGIVLGVALAGLSGAEGAAARRAVARAGEERPGIEVAPSRTRPAGEGAAWRFARRRDGLPVLRSDAVVLLDPAGEARLAPSGPLPPVEGAFRLAEAAAVSTARAALGPGAQLSGTVRAERGWLPVLGRLRPVWRVSLPARTPAGDWRADVDADSGALLALEDRRRSASGRVYLLSPAESPGSVCGLLATGVHAACTTPSVVPLAGLAPASGPGLQGVLAEVVNCQGTNPPMLGTTPGSCAATATPDGAGDYLYAPDLSAGSYLDTFAEVNAWWNLAESAALFARLAPGAAPLPHLRVYVNAAEDGSPLDNAFYSPSDVALVFGQGAAVDFAYDGSVATHELGHAFIEAQGGLDAFLDGQGACEDGWALHEGIADVFATERTGRPEVGLYVGAAAGEPYVRTLASTAVPTCGGRGRVVPLAGVNSVDGRVGESHEDGAIWGAFYWELHQGLAGVRGCGGACSAAAELQALALEGVAGTTDVTFHRMGDAVVAAAQVLYPARPGVAEYAACLVRRHELAGCDTRVVPLYRNESKVLAGSQSGKTEYGPLQVSLKAGATGPANVCSAVGTSGTLYLRQGAEVLLAPDGAGGTTVTSTSQFAVSDGACIQVTLVGGATWYALLAAAPSASPGVALWLVQGGPGVALRPSAPALETCRFEPPPAPPGGGGGGGGCGSAGAAGAEALLGLGALAALRRRRRPGPGGARHCAT